MASAGVPMRFKGTAQTKAFIGTLPGYGTDKSLLSAIKSTPDKPLAADVQIIYSYREQSGIFCCVIKRMNRIASVRARK